jgi:hypothetical protein
VWSIGHEFVDAKTNINPTNANTTFSYEYAGTVRTLTIPPNTSLDNLKNMINNDTQNPGVRAFLIKSANGVTFQIKGMDQGTNNDLRILHTDGLTGFPAKTDYDPHKIQYVIAFDSENDKIFETGNTKVFTYSFNGTDYNVNVTAGMTVKQFQTAINASKPAGMKNVELGTEGFPPRRYPSFLKARPTATLLTFPSPATGKSLARPKPFPPTPPAGTFSTARTRRLKWTAGPPAAETGWKWIPTPLTTWWKALPSPWSAKVKPPSA